MNSFTANEPDASEFYRDCRLCPRRCGVDRTAGETGVCGENSVIHAARAALHFWEEPCISGREGSGAVFFSGCALGCVYCQNREISDGSFGRALSVERLAEIFLELQGKGANNINLVTPDHFAPSVVRSLRLAKPKLHIPVICNCSGYMSEEAFRLLSPCVDVWLPDLKYYDPKMAEKYSHAPDYFGTAAAALKLMYESAGDPAFDGRGMITRGVIVRHLVLPGHCEDSKKIIHYLYDTYKDHIYISIMNQFTPMPGLSETGSPELARKLTAREYDSVVDYAIGLGVENGFIQEGETAEDSFIPPFDYDGL